MSVEPRAKPGREGISRAVSKPSNTLVLLPHLHDHDVGVCLDLLTVAEPAEENVLAVSFEETAADKSRRWSEGVGTQPRELAVVEVSPSDDVASLAETISGQLAEWESSDARTVVCFQSLAPLLERNDLRGAFRFLHLLLRRLESANAVAHFHLDPDTVDDRTLYTLFPLFDTVVEHDESGSIRVSDGGPD